MRLLIVAHSRWKAAKLVEQLFIIYTINNRLSQLSSFDFHMKSAGAISSDREPDTCSCEQEFELEFAKVDRYAIEIKAT